MIVQRVYFGDKTVKRIYLNGELIWMLGDYKLSIEHISDIMSDGFHAVLSGETIVLYSDVNNVSVQECYADVLHAITINAERDSRTHPDANLIPHPAVVLNSECNSATQPDGNIMPCSAIVICCDATSIVTEQMDALVANAISFMNIERHETDTEVSALIASISNISHEEDMGIVQEEIHAEILGAVHIASDEYNGITAEEIYTETLDSTYLSFSENNAVTNEEELYTTVSETAHLSFDEDNGITEEKIYQTISNATHLAFDKDNGTKHESCITTIEPDGIINLSAEVTGKLHTEQYIHTASPTEMSSYLHYKIVCEAYLSATTVVEINTSEAFKTTTEADMQFLDGELEDGNFTDLYTELIIADEEGTVFLEVDGIDYPLENTSDPIKMGVDDIYTIEII